MSVKLISFLLHKQIIFFFFFFNYSLQRLTDVLKSLRLRTVIGLHTAASGDTKGFIQLFSHMQSYFPTPDFTDVQISRLPLKNLVQTDNKTFI